MHIMNKAPFRTCLLLASLLGASIAAHAADSFQASLQAGNDAIGAQDFAKAMAEFTTARQQAANDRETACAISKLAYIKSRQGDYAGAKADATQALGMQIAPADQAVALQVVGKAQMVSDEDYAAAIKTLEEAREITGADFIQPDIVLMLGDCYRKTGDTAKAIALYEEIPTLPAANDWTKGTASFSIGMVRQYDTKENDKAREAYAQAVKINPGLQKEVAAHLERMQ